VFSHKMLVIVKGIGKPVFFLLPFGAGLSEILDFEAKSACAFHGGCQGIKQVRALLRALLHFGLGFDLNSRGLALGEPPKSFCAFCRDFPGQLAKLLTHDGVAHGVTRVP